MLELLMQLAVALLAFAIGVVCGFWLGERVPWQLALWDEPIWKRIRNALDGRP